MINILSVLVFWGIFILGSLFFLNYFASESKTRTFSVFLLFLALLSIVFFPGITGHYLYHDDVFLWDWQRTHWATHVQYIQQGKCGRPLAKFIMFSMDSLVGTINSANIVRFFTIVIISLIALAIDIWLRRICGFLKRDSFLVSLAIVVLPPFQVYVYPVAAFYVPVAILLSIFSAFVLLKQERNQERLINFRFFEWPLYSLFLLLCSLMTYQSGSTFFIALLAIWLIGADCREMNNIKWPWLHLAIFFIAVLIYFIFFKMLVPANAMGEGSIYNNSVAFNYGQKLCWFFRQPMVAALNLWQNVLIFSSRAVAVGVFSIIFLGIVSEFLYLMRSEDVSNKGILARNLLFKYLAILVLILLSCCVTLVIHAYVSFYRTLAPLMAIVFILFWNGIRRILVVFLKQGGYETIATVVLIFICICAMIFAQVTFRKYCVDNNSRELRYIENEIISKYNSHIQRVYVIRPTCFVKGNDNDEFGNTTCFWSHDVPGLVKAAFQEKGIISGASLNVTSVTAKDFISQDPHLLIIDLNKNKEILDKKLKSIASIVE